MKKGTSHKADIVRLNKIIGQLAGIKQMITDERYCYDILIQVCSTQGSLRSLGINILDNHLKMCVKEAICCSNIKDKQEKIDEVRHLIKIFNK